WRRAQAWYEILRPFSWTASIIPVSAAGGVAWYTGQFVLWLYLLALVGAVGIQAGTNIINEIYDVRQGIDKITSPRASHALLKGRLTEGEGFAVLVVAFLAATGIGLWLATQRGWPVIALGLAGLLGGWGYTAPPLGEKLRALGLPVVFLLFGPLSVIGAYYV